MKMAIMLHRSLRVTGLKNELFTVIYRVKVLFFHIFKWILEKIRKRREAVFSQNDKINKKGGELKGILYSKLQKMKSKMGSLGCNFIHLFTGEKRLKKVTVKKALSRIFLKFDAKESDCFTL
ncbi:hypothetical protein [Cytobacillus firmus]|uniref:hypothetical protein n=1 Tax=Cytobacillus firmus TaxID=1399 RepID=UPI0020303824|nr:hypothetical protein [Cytobacillus firmus]URT72302.1 hypothetical protein NAF01_07625 [Cytobacillus firmus]